jgi:uncharacterized protein YoxC
MKKILGMFIMMLMVVSAFSITALADDEERSFEDRKGPRLQRFGEDRNSDGLSDEEIADLENLRAERKAAMDEKAAEREEALREKLSEEGLSDDEIDEKVEKRMDNARRKIGHRISQFSTAAFRAEDLSEEEIDKFKKMRRDQIKDVLGQDDVEDARAKLARFKEQRIDFVKRDVSDRVRGQSEERFDVARDRFKEVDEETQERRDAFQEARELLRTCEEDCEDEEADVLARAKEFVLNAGEKVVTHIEKVIAKIEGNENIDPERAEEILEKLNAATEEVKSAMDAAEAATTKEELRAAGKDINSIWSRVKHTAQAATARHLNGRLHGMIKHSEALENKFDRVIAAIEDKGIEVEDLDSKVEDFGNHLATATELYEKSEALLDEAKELKGADGEKDAMRALIDEAKDLGKQSHDALKDAHEIVVELVKQIKAVDSTADLETQDSDEVELVI